MNIETLTRLARTSLLAITGLMLVSGCTESTTSTSSTSSPPSASTPMNSGQPSRTAESQSYFSESPPPPPSRTNTVATTTTTITPPPPPPAATASSASMLPSYTQDAAIRGRLRSIGSDTMDKMMADWEEGFKTYHPGIRVIHEGKGSSTAIPALVEGRSDFGPMSRDVKPAEAARFEQQFGYKPTSLPVAIDALAVYVHPQNPIKDRGLSLAELDAIFSSTNRRGHTEIITWGDLGLAGDWANKPINVYSRNSASGTYGFFKDEVLNKGDFKTTNRELVGSEEVVRSVENDLYGIGYSGFGYKTPGVAIVPLSNGGSMIEANQENAVDGTYPLARNLYLIINHQPGTEPKTLYAEFIRYVYSQEGQNKVSQNGYFPVSNNTANQQLNSLGIQ